MTSRTEINASVLKDLINSRPYWFCLVLEYGISHSVARLALHLGDYLNRYEVIVGGVDELRFRTSDDSVRVRFDQVDHEGTLYELEAGTVFVRFHRVGQLERVGSGVNPG